MAFGYTPFQMINGKRYELHNDADYEECVDLCMEEGMVEDAEELLTQISDVETRVYLADQHNLPLDEGAENWARREHKAYVDGMGW